MVGVGRFEYFLIQHHFILGGNAVHRQVEQHDDRPGIRIGRQNGALDIQLCSVLVRDEAVGIGRAAANGETFVGIARFGFQIHLRGLRPAPVPTEFLVLDPVILLYARYLHPLRHDIQRKDGRVVLLLANGEFKPGSLVRQRLQFHIVNRAVVPVEADDRFRRTRITVVGRHQRRLAGDMARNS